MKIGFIGCGNMAGAIINGLISSGTAEGKDINIFDINENAMYALKEQHGCNICKDEEDTAERSNVLFLAVKPNVIGSVIGKISKAASRNDCLIISIAAGKDIEFLESNALNQLKIVRVMPNINAKAGEAISAYCANENVTEEDKKTVEALLQSFGKYIALDEKFFPVFGVIGGCSPAFAYMFIDALARAAVKNGMNKKDALMISAQAVYGSAKMILESDKHPFELIDNVCSPGGTTIEGVLSLQEDGFEAAVHNAVNKAVEKDKRL